MLTPANSLEAAFTHHARRKERVVSVDGGPAAPPRPCAGCGRELEPPLAFAGGDAPQVHRFSAPGG